MTHAYQEMYLSNAQALLGDAFDYAVNACGISGNDFVKLFSVSSVSKRIENGEPAYLAGKAELKSWKMFLSRQPAKRQLPNRRQRSAVPESIGLAGLSRTINGSPAGNSAIFSRSFRSRICSRCTLRFTKQTSANLPILPMPKCVRILQIPISSASVQPTAAHKQSLPSEAASASGQFKCTSSTTRISIKPARKRFSALPKSLAAQWRIFWKSEINATIAKYEKENAMWRCTINRKTSPLNSPYTEITDEWLRETPTKTNLKNALVADIDADGIIYKSIMEYVQLLNEKAQISHCLLLAYAPVK